ncbi:MAG: UDP-N-acetylmuramoyl-L-alanine--D-glutamate ligase [Chitinophagaceae bacterium]|nr:UDP-N-acetylmuramoyl-L-alanine--D-glutamate ligase [Polaromonas sp.]
MARWCASYGAVVTVVDNRPAPPQLSALRDVCPNVTFIQAQMTAELLQLASFDQVLQSPGLSPASTFGVISAAQLQGIACGNELSLFAQALAALKQVHGYAPAVVGITGTNGKTTVTSLTAQLVERAGKSVAMAGNIGPTLLDTLAAALSAAPQAWLKTWAVLNDTLTSAVSGDSVRADYVVGSSCTVEVDETNDSSQPSGIDHNMPDVWVLELSSFQLRGIRNFEPTVATVLNLTQDHLDWHQNFADYAQAKAQIYGTTGVMLLNRNDPQLMAALPPLVKGKQLRSYITFGNDEPSRPGDYGIETVNGMAWLVRAVVTDETIKRRKNEETGLHIQRLMPVEALRIHGGHNASNALAAVALAAAAGCSLAPMLHGLREYRGEPHRVQSVGIINGIEFFDDSKGTNVGATVAALTGLAGSNHEQKLVVILGGEGKGQDFSPLLDPMTKHVRAGVLIGRDALIIEAAVKNSGVQILHADSMAHAVKLAAQHAQPGDAVLMSPACASFDMFNNYEHRAHVFCEAVQALADDAAVTL